MGFANDILGGAAALIRAAIKSPNYVASSAGWSVNKDGSAEFSNITIRGGSIISGTTLNYSSHPPALGTLVSSDSPAGGTDAVGNAYLPGLVTYLAIAGHYLAVQLWNGSLFLQSNTTYGGAYTAYGEINIGGGPSMQFSAGSSTAFSFNPTVPVQCGALQASGAAVLSGGVAVTSGTTTDTLNVTSTSTFGAKETITAGGLAVTGGTTTDTLTVTGTSALDGTATLADASTLASNGIHVATTLWGNSGTLTIGDNVSMASGKTITADTWNAVTLPTGMTGTIRVKILPLAKFAALDINVTITSTSTSPVAFNAGSLPSASYYPTGQRQYDLSVQQQFTATSNASPRVNIPVSGALQLDMPGFATAALSCLVSGTIVYPLD